MASQRTSRQSHHFETRLRITATSSVNKSARASTRQAPDAPQNRKQLGGSINNGIGGHNRDPTPARNSP